MFFSNIFEYLSHQKLVNYVGKQSNDFKSRLIQLVFMLKWTLYSYTSINILNHSLGRRLVKK